MNGDIAIMIALLALGTLLIKCSGTVLLGGRQLPVWALRVFDLTAPAMLAALIVFQVFSAGDGGIAFDERILGLASAGVCLRLQTPIVVVIVVAAATTALARSLL